MSSEDLDVLVIGSGAREHALVRSLLKSKRVGRVVGAPGNPGIDDDSEVVNVKADDIPALIAFAERERIDLVVVGPEAPLVDGLADQLRDRGIAVFGPGADGARIEGSKSFAKEIMKAAGVPTGEARYFTSYEEAHGYLVEQGAPVVIKADGLAAGKGVVVAQTLEEAEQALKDCFIARRFGEAGRKVLIEEFLEGEEVSLLSVVSGQQILPLVPAQDYKRVYDNDQGPNTGGMGAYSPVPTVDDALVSRIVDEVVRPTVAAMAERGIDYRGVLYAGLMLTSSGPRVLEFNCRFGDPETQVILPRLDSDLLDLLWAAAVGDTLPSAVKWRAEKAVGVVIASEGYPASVSPPRPITGFEEVLRMENVEIFHAGTARVDGCLMAAGGRVLTVVGKGLTFAEARANAYQAAKAIRFEGAHYRTDIALRAEEWEKRQT